MGSFPHLAHAVQVYTKLQPTAFVDLDLEQPSMAAINQRKAHKPSLYSDDVWLSFYAHATQVSYGLI